MPKGKRKPQSGIRPPSLRGAVAVDEIYGKPRARAWPRPRGKDRHPTNVFWTKWLVGITFLWKYQPAKFQAQLQEATKQTPWMPRDPFISAARGRAWSFTDQTGRTFYPKVVKEAVSQSLDAIGQLAGQMLFRLASGWEPVPPPTDVNQVLTSTGPDTAPEWVESSGGTLPAPGIWLPDVSPATPGPNDDEFSVPGAGVPPGWTETDHGGTLTVSVDDAGLVLAQPVNGAASWAGIRKALPAGDFTIWTKVAPNNRRQTGHDIGLIFWAAPGTATADLVSFTVRLTSGGTQVMVNSWTQWNGTDTTLASTGGVSTATPSMYLRVRRTGATWNFDYSGDGLGWQQLPAVVMPFVPTHVGPGQQNFGSGIANTGRVFFYRDLASDVGLPGLMAGRRV